MRGGDAVADDGTNVDGVVGPVETLERPEVGGMMVTVFGFILLEANAVFDRLSDFSAPVLRPRSSRKPRQLGIGADGDQETNASSGLFGQRS
jgi:hypothetical protein